MKQYIDEGNSSFFSDVHSEIYVDKMSYYTARAYYSVFRELPTGKGFADIAFLPKTGVIKPAMIVELKWNKSAETAIDQITARAYFFFSASMKSLIHSLSTRFMVASAMEDSSAKVSNCSCFSSSSSIIASSMVFSQRR